MSELVHTGAAIAPILSVFGLLALRFPSLFAGVVGLVVAVIAAATMFRPDDDEIIAAAIQLGPTVLEVALILLGGVTLAVAMSASGSRDHIADWLTRAVPSEDRIPVILLLVFGLTPFMESVTGFGLGVVITAPLLVRIGLSPVTAVVSGLLGLTLVPWGSLGPGTLVAAELGDQDFAALGVWSALLTLPVLLMSTVTLVLVLRPRLTARLALLCASVVVVQWSTLVAANMLLGTPPAGIVASVAVIAFLVGVSRVRGGAPPRASRELVRAVSPFVVLLSGILGTTAALSSGLIPAAASWLDSPALWVNIAALVALRASVPTVAHAFPLVREALGTWVPVAGNAIIFMAIGIVMATAGMASHLAQLASGAGDVALALTPAAGAAGGYLTGSNTGAAAMLSSATTGVASDIGASPLVALAGQNVAGSYAIIVSPPRVALAVGVVLSGTKLPGRAGRTLGAAVVAATVVLGAAVYLLG